MYMYALINYILDADNYQISSGKELIWKKKCISDILF